MVLRIGLWYWLAGTCCAQTLPDSGRSTRHLLFFPAIERSIETGWGAGIAGSVLFRFNPRDTVTRTSNFQTLALYTWQRQFVTGLNGTIFFPGERYILGTQMSYSRFPDKFWGLGNRTPDSQEEAYKFRQYYIYLHLQRLLSRNWFVGSLFEFQRLLHVDFKEGGVLDRERVLGRFPYQIAGLGLSLTYDSRNNAFAPTAGAFAQAYFNHFGPHFASDFRYTNYVVDLRAYQRLIGQHVLALQTYGFFCVGDVPLRSLATLGGSNSMRGYYDGRFRDKNQVVLQAEYRAPLFWRIGAVVFGSVGNVSGQPGTTLLNNVKGAYGAGLRFALKPNERLNLRIDYGIGQGTSQGLYFQLGEAF